MVHIKAGDAILAGMGFAMGLALANRIFETAKPYTRVTQQLLCLKCGRRNPLENKFCWQCGRALYPLPTTQCTRCGATVPSMKYCGNCGSQLKD